MGNSLKWDPLPGGNDCRIAKYVDNRVELERRKDWPDHFEWLKDQCESFVDVFRSLVKELGLDHGRIDANRWAAESGESSTRVAPA